MCEASECGYKITNELRKEWNEFQCEIKEKLKPYPCKECTDELSGKKMTIQQWQKLKKNPHVKDDYYVCDACIAHEENRIKYNTAHGK